MPEQLHRLDVRGPEYPSYDRGIVVVYVVEVNVVLVALAFVVPFDQLLVLLGKGLHLHAPLAFHLSSGALAHLFLGLVLDLLGLQLLGSGSHVY